MLDLRRVVRLLSSAAILGATLLVPGAVAADTFAPAGVALDCAPSPPLDEAVVSAHLVFVGTVTETSSDGRSATVTVTEVWRGDVPSPVIVNGWLDPASAAEDDRTFQAGLTYVFVPVNLDNLAGGLVIDSICSSTVQWTDDLARLRPANVGAPLTGPAPGANPFAFLGWLVMPLAMAGLIGGGAIALALFVARRRDT